MDPRYSWDQVPQPGEMCECLRHPLEILLTAYFSGSETKYTLTCINIHSGNRLALQQKVISTVFLVFALGHTVNQWQEN